MKKRINTFSLVIMLSLLSSSVTAQVKSDFDNTVDFSRYKTYTLEGWQKDSDQQLNDLDKGRILKALKAEFSARGLENVESNGDASLTLYIVFNIKSSTTAYTTYNGNMGYRGRWGWGGGYGMGSATTSYSESDYLEGTFVIDMYDSESKNLIWQGVITTVVKEDPSKREKTIPKKMSKLMKKYPVKSSK